MSNQKMTKPAFRSVELDPMDARLEARAAEMVGSDPHISQVSRAARDDSNLGRSASLRHLPVWRARQRGPVSTSKYRTTPGSSSRPGRRGRWYPYGTSS